MSHRDPEVAGDRGRPRRQNEQRKEGFTMALYVSVCLLAALTGLPDDADRHTLDVLGIVWGTTIGLALAHLFAFRLSARLVESGDSAAKTRNSRLPNWSALPPSPQRVRSRSSSFLHLQSLTPFGSCSQPSSPSSRYCSRSEQSERPQQPHASAHLRERGVVHRGRGCDREEHAQRSLSAPAVRWTR